MTSEFITYMQETLKDSGLKIYAGNPETTNSCYITDGKNICSASYTHYSGFRLDTVHKQNKRSGTGFGYSDTITLRNIFKAMECIAPGWATSGDWVSVRKYKDWADFVSSSPYNQGLAEVK